MKQEIIDLYDQYAHYGLDRRLFMERLAKLAGGTAAASAAFGLLAANHAKAATVAADDSRLVTARVAIPVSGGELKGYLARPAASTDKLGAVIVVHENRGLNPHTEDVARRMALEGFVVLAPDFLSPAGGTPDDPDKARDLIGGLDAAMVVSNADAAMTWLRQQPDSNGKVGIVGFCWGGGVVGRVAAEAPSLDGGVVFYGRTPPLDSVASIKAPLLLNYGGLDERINADVPAFEAALKAAGVRYEAFIYDGANHAFMNDTSEARYDPQAAKLAWERTVAFFKANLA